MWAALLIPIVALLIANYWWRRNITKWELIVPVLASLITIAISYGVIRHTSLQDVEYNGHLVTSARYYESWNTWVDQTCTETYACGSDSKGNTQYCTRTYDCSYCDDNSAQWIAYTQDGKSFQISQERYNQLKARWSATPAFVELNRRIVHHGRCGVDGDAYEIRWDGQILTSENAVTEITYINILKQNHSAFSYLPMSDEEADSLGLYRYPSIHSLYKQSAILSTKFIVPDSIKIKLQYINSILGPVNKVKIFTLLFVNRPYDIAVKQEQYWQNGNRNELVVCIGIDSVGNINWTYPFSWCDNKRIIVDTRDDIGNMEVLDLNRLHVIYYKNVKEFFHYKSFEDFNYMQFEPTNRQLRFVYIITAIITILSILYIVRNKIDQ